MEFAANLSTLFTEVPFPERFGAAAAAGFALVECQFPYDHDAGALAACLRGHGLRQVLLNLPPGDWAAGERGMACHPGREAAFAGSLGTALAYAGALDCPRLHAMAGLAPEGADPAALRRTFVASVARAAREAVAEGRQVLIEPINPFDVPGYFLDDFGLALAIIDEIEAMGGPAPGLQFDLYHCARIHGDVAEWIRRSAPRTAHYQVASPEGRHEPDPAWLRPLLDVIGEETPGLAIGCEYTPRGRTEDGLGWLAAVR